MNKSVLMIMGGALIVAIVVAVVVQAKLSPKSSATAPETVEILVAARSLTPGASLKSSDVRWQAWPESALYKGVVRKSDQPDIEKLSVYETPIRRAIESGEPVTSQALIPDIKGGTNFLAASISPGMRAVAISVKADTSVGGFVAPGDHVDVIMAYAPPLSPAARQYSGGVVQQSASQTVLSNVRVLAIDQSASEAGREAKVGKTVTLEVSREGAEMLALAERMGSLSLALRRIGDEDVASPDARPLITDMKTSDVARRLHALMGRAKVDGNSVRVYSGSSAQNMPVRAVPEEEKAGD